MPGQNILIILAGPTAVGKTDCSLILAKKYNSAIFSADSRQLYKEMSIGTAKPSTEVLAEVNHHFINHVSIHAPYDAGKYEKEVLAAFEHYFSGNSTAILTGGTGMYIKAVTDGLDIFPAIDKQVLETVKRDYSEHGINFLRQELKKSDELYSQRVDLDNPHRLIRALSVIRQTGKPFSSYLGKEKTSRSFSPIFILLNREREELYNRINQRVDQMIQDGLLEEAKGLYDHRHLTSLQTVGYQELFEFMEGKITIEQAIDLIKRNSRRYAKRQLTWFRKDKRWKNFHPDNIAGITSWIAEKMN